MSTYNEELQQNNAELEELLEMAQSLPDAGGGGDYIPVPETAEVGQTIRVAEVDENGKPTAWEAVDFPSGGGGGFEVIASGELTEETTQITISADNDGTPFELSLAALGLKIEGSAANSGNGTVRIRTNTNSAAKGGQHNFVNGIRQSGSGANIDLMIAGTNSLHTSAWSSCEGAINGALNANYEKLSAIYITGIDTGKQTFGVGTRWVLRGIRA